MKNFKKTLIGSALALMAMSAVAQQSMQTTAQRGTPTAQPGSPAPQAASVNAAPGFAVTDINPLTGKLLSEEHLQRELSKAKLLTQLSQETLKQKEIGIDLSLTDLRQETEKTRILSEQLKVKQGMDAMLPAVPAKAAASSKKPAANTSTGSQASAVRNPATGAPLTGNLGTVGTAGSDAAAEALARNMRLQQELQRASARNAGVIQIGNETIKVSSDFRGEVSQVSYVDLQVRLDPSGRGGTSIVPSATQQTPRMPTVIPGTPLSGGVPSSGAFIQGASLPEMPGFANGLPGSNR